MVEFTQRLLSLYLAIKSDREEGTECLSSWLTGAECGRPATLVGYLWDAKLSQHLQVNVVLGARWISVISVYSSVTLQICCGQDLQRPTDSCPANQKARKACDLQKCSGTGGRGARETATVSPTGCVWGRVPRSCPLAFQFYKGTVAIFLAMRIYGVWILGSVGCSLSLWLKDWKWA